MLILKDNGTVYIATDAYDMNTICETSATISKYENSFVWKINGATNCLMANTEHRDSDLLRYTKLFRGKTISYHKIVTEVEPKIRKLFEDYGRIDSETKQYLSQTFFAQNDKAYQISEYGAILEIDNFLVTGVMSDEITAYLIATQNNGDSPEKRIVAAEKYAEKSWHRVVFPILIINTMTMRIKVLHK